MSSAVATVPNAALICRQYVVSEEAQVLLAADCTPQAFADALIRGGLYDDAIEFVAHWLPKREAVWWGCLGAWYVARPRPEAEAEAALQAVVAWLGQPTEALRRAAERAGKALGPTDPCGAVALAAFWSEGNMSAAELPSVAPAPTLTAETIVGAMLAIAGQQGPVQRNERLRQLLRIGLEVASGQNRWE